MVHVELTDQDMKRVADGGKHCKLLAVGWVYSENDDGTEGFYSKPDAFDAGNLCLEDAWKLHNMIEAWGKMS